MVEEVLIQNPGAPEPQRRTFSLDGVFRRAHVPIRARTMSCRRGRRRRRELHHHIRRAARARVVVARFVEPT